MNTKYTKSVVAGGIFLIGLGVLIFAAFSPSPTPSSSSDEKVSFTVDAKEIDGILTRPDTPAPYPAIIPVSGAGVTPAEQEVYRVEAMSRAAGFDDNEIAKAALMRRLMVDVLLDEPMYQQINLAESNRLGDGPWREMTELVYSPQARSLPRRPRLPR